MNIAIETNIGNSNKIVLKKKLKRSKVAQLIDAPKGKTKEVLDSETPILFLHTCIVVAKLALLLPVDIAII